MTAQMLDLTAQLRGTIQNTYYDDDEPSDVLAYQSLPPVDAEFEAVFVTDDLAHTGCTGPWIVHCNTGISYADAEEATGYAAALAAAARQARILNADGRVVSVPDDGRFSASMLESPAPIVRMVEAGYDDHFRVAHDDTSSTPLTKRAAGYTWRRDGYGFVYYGMFTWFGEEEIDGRRHVLLKEASRG